MSLKLLTGFCLAVGFAVLVAWSMLLAARPGKGAPREERRVYAVRLVSLAGMGILSVVGASIGSIFLMRQAREEFRDASRRNIDSLLQGAREDRERKRDA